MQPGEAGPGRLCCSTGPFPGSLPGPILAGRLGLLPCRAGPLPGGPCPSSVAKTSARSVPVAGTGGGPKSGSSHVAQTAQPKSTWPRKCRATVVILAWLAMGFVYLTAFSQPCCGQTSKSIVSFSLFLVSCMKRRQGGASSQRDLHSVGGNHITNREAQRAISLMQSLDEINLSIL